MRLSTFLKDKRVQIAVSKIGDLKKKKLRSRLMRLSTFLKDKRVQIAVSKIGD